MIGIYMQPSLNKKRAIVILFQSTVSTVYSLYTTVKFLCFFNYTTKENWNMIIFFLARHNTHFEDNFWILITIQLNKLLLIMISHVILRGKNTFEPHSFQFNYLQIIFYIADPNAKNKFIKIDNILKKISPKGNCINNINDVYVNLVISI